MKVYIVCIHWHCDATDILGVYDTKEKAEANETYIEYTKEIFDRPIGHRVYIDERVVE